MGFESGFLKKVIVLKQKARFEFSNRAFFIVNLLKNYANIVTGFSINVFKVCKN